MLPFIRAPAITRKGAEVLAIGFTAASRRSFTCLGQDGVGELSVGAVIHGTEKPPTLRGQQLDDSSRQSGLQGGNQRLASGADRAGQSDPRWQPLVGASFASHAR